MTSALIISDHAGSKSQTNICSAGESAVLGGRMLLVDPLGVQMESRLGAERGIADKRGKKEV